MICYDGFMDQHEAEIAELSMALGLLVRRIRSAAPPEFFDLSWTQRAVLRRLESDGPSSSADLARAEGIKPQSMGAAITALEELKLVERKPHPSDKRQIIVRLTAKGAGMRKNLVAAKHDWLSHAIEKLSKEERKTLFAAGHIMKRMVE